MTFEYVRTPLDRDGREGILLFSAIDSFSETP